jgi:hypothetical protein
MICPRFRMCSAADMCLVEVDAFRIAPEVLLEVAANSHRSEARVLDPCGDRCMREEPCLVTRKRVGGFLDTKSDDRPLHVAIEYHWKHNMCSVQPEFLSRPRHKVL